MLWNIEVFRSVEAEDAYEKRPLSDALRDEIRECLDEMVVMRIEARFC